MARERSRALFFAGTGLPARLRRPAGSTFSRDVGAGLPLAFAIAKLFKLKIEDIFQPE